MAGLFEKLFAPELALERQLRLFAERELKQCQADLEWSRDQNILMRMAEKAESHAARIREDALVNQILTLAGAKPAPRRETLAPDEPVDDTVKLDKDEEDALMQRAHEGAEQAFGTMYSHEQMIGKFEEYKKNPDYYLSDI